MNRRTILTALPALALIACQPGATPQTQLQTTAALVTAGVAAVAISVLATPNLAPDTAAKINSAVASVNAANGVIQGATATPGTAAQQIVVAVRLAAPLLLGVLNASSPEAIAIQAALALLPTILAAAGVPPVQAMAGPAGMEPAEAALILKGYTRK